MHGTSIGNEIFQEVSKCVTEMKLPQDQLVGLTTDGEPTTCGQKSGQGTGEDVGGDLCR